MPKVISKVDNPRGFSAVSGTTSSTCSRAPWPWAAQVKIPVTAWVTAVPPGTGHEQADRSRLGWVGTPPRSCRAQADRVPRRRFPPSSARPRRRPGVRWSAAPGDHLGGCDDRDGQPCGWGLCRAARWISRSATATRRPMPTGRHGTSLPCWLVEDETREGRAITGSTPEMMSAAASTNRTARDPPRLLRAKRTSSLAASEGGSAQVGRTGPARLRQPAGPNQVTRAWSSPARSLSCAAAAQAV
jgi:hypothetical protein